MIVVVMGVSGSGKTTVGRLLAAALGWPFYDADDFHPRENVEKMTRGEPLTDEDRTPWLEALAGLITAVSRGGESAVLACSALKRAYRARLSITDDDVRFVFLDAPPSAIAERMARRKGHFMPPSQLAHQLGALEPPDDAIRADASRPAEEVVEGILSALDD